MTVYLRLYSFKLYVNRKLLNLYNNTIYILNTYPDPKRNTICIIIAYIINIATFIIILNLRSRNNSIIMLSNKLVSSDFYKIW